MQKAHAYPQRASEGSSAFPTDLLFCLRAAMDCLVALYRGIRLQHFLVADNTPTSHVSKFCTLVTSSNLLLTDCLHTRQTKAEMAKSRNLVKPGWIY